MKQISKGEYESVRDHEDWDIRFCGVPPIYEELDDCTCQELCDVCRDLRMEIDELKSLLKIEREYHKTKTPF